MALNLSSLNRCKRQTEVMRDCWFGAAGKKNDAREFLVRSRSARRSERGW